MKKRRKGVWGNRGGNCSMAIQDGPWYLSGVENTNARALVVWFELRPLPRCQWHPGVAISRAERPWSTTGTGHLRAGLRRDSLHASLERSFRRLGRSTSRATAPGCRVHVVGGCVRETGEAGEARWQLEAAVDRWCPRTWAPKRPAETLIAISARLRPRRPRRRRRCHRRPSAARLAPDTRRA